MFGEKSQSSLLIIVSIVAVTAVIWILSMYNQTTYTKESLKNFMMSKMQQYIENFKGFTKTALTLASHQSTKNIAKNGGSNIGTTRTWICTSPSVPSVDEIKYYLSEDTKKILNSYMIKSNKSKEDEGVEFFSGKFNCIDYNVNQQDIMSGTNDESFDVGAYGSYLYINDGNFFINSSNNVYQDIGKVRFWYLYRNFRRWAEDNVFSRYMCGCMMQICNCNQAGECQSNCPGFYQCYTNAVQKALENLQNRFDSYVTCQANYGCCHQEKQSCGDVTSCVYWDESPTCNNCYYGSYGDLCIQDELKLSSYDQSKPFVYSPANAQTLQDDCSDQIVEMWSTVKSSVEATFSCTDKKYRLSVPGQNYLTFSVHTNVAIQSRNCYTMGQCECDWSCSTGVFDSNLGLCVDAITRIPLAGVQPQCDRCVPENLKNSWCTGCKTPDQAVAFQDPPSIGHSIPATDIPWTHTMYSGDFRQIFEQIKKEMGVNIDLSDDCTEEGIRYWCYVTKKGCKGLAVYCKYNVLSGLGQNELNILFRHELLHGLQFSYGGCKTGDQSEWGAEYYSGSRYYCFEFEGQRKSAGEIGQILVDRGCSEDDVKRAAFCDPNAVNKLISSGCMKRDSIKFC
ncbi:MAG: hypothetical protein QXM68_01350 [Candidatus Aenigmatarchaeota archaeon]|nr:hypothetical protein [Candidatus Aenigmarchaeota archaeon]